MMRKGPDCGGVLGAALLGFAFCLSGAGSVSALDLLSEAPTINVKTRAIDQFEIGRDQDRFGALTYLGGLELISADRNTGGLSGLISLEGGAGFLAVTDNGYWFTAGIEQDVSGKPLALTNPRYAAMLGPNGKTLRAAWGHDTEAVVLDGDSLLVTAERANAIYRFPWPLKSGKERMIGPLAVSDEIKGLRSSKGLEALALGPVGSPLSGTLVAIAERGKSESHDLPGFLLKSGTEKRFTIERSGRYDATDAVFLPDGDLLLLERRFNLRDLVGMRLRRFEADTIVEGANLSGSVLMEANFSHQIDNMEGLAVHVNAAGQSILTLLSDNNRSLLQRTLLLRFRLDE